MSDQDEAMLMTVSDRTDVLQAFTSDRNKLRNALQAARVSTRSTDLQSAIRAAEACPLHAVQQPIPSNQRVTPIRRHRRVKTQHVFMLFSDGRFATPEDWDDSRLRPAYIR